MKTQKEPRKRLFGYIRVSTKKQAEEGVSLEAQDKMLKQYAEIYNIELVRIIIDSGESAKSLKRDGVQEIIEGMESGEAEGVLVTKLDRFARNRGDFFNLIDKYFSKKFSFVSVSEQMDTKSASGRLAVNILSDVSQWEREVIAERTSVALQYKRSKGEYTGGVVPYGFSLHENGVNLLPNEAERLIIAEAKIWRSREYSYAKISKILAKQGHLSRKDKPFNSKSIMLMVT